MQRCDAFVTSHHKLIDTYDSCKYSHREGSHEIPVWKDIKWNWVSRTVQWKDHDKIERQESKDI